MASPMDSFGSRASKIAAVIALYWVISISMVFLNKYLLSSPELKLDAPLFITWFQCLVAVACCYILPTLKPFHSAFEMFPNFEVKLDICIKCLPLSAVFVGMIAFNNLCLKEIGVSFYNVGRSLTTIWNVALTYLMLGQKTSPRALACCLVLVLGFILGVDQEVSPTNLPPIPLIYVINIYIYIYFYTHTYIHTCLCYCIWHQYSDMLHPQGSLGDLSVHGVVYGVLASLFVALNAIYVKKILPIVDNDSWKLTLYNNLNAFVLFVPLMVTTTH